MTSRILTENLPGNVHESASYINKCGVAEYLISIDFSGGYNSTGVFRVNSYEEYLDYAQRTRARNILTQTEYET